MVTSSTGRGRPAHEADEVRFENVFFEFRFLAGLESPDDFVGEFIEYDEFVDDVEFDDCVAFSEHFIYDPFVSGGHVGCHPNNKEYNMSLSKLLESLKTKEKRQAAALNETRAQIKDIEKLQK